MFIEIKYIGYLLLSHVLLLSIKSIYLQENTLCGYLYPHKGRQKCCQLCPRFPAIGCAWRETRIDSSDHSIIRQIEDKCLCGRREYRRIKSRLDSRFTDALIGQDHRRTDLDLLSLPDACIVYCKDLNCIDCRR